MLRILVCSWTFVFIGYSAVSVNATVVVPAGLNPGDSYHLAFITDGKRDATSTNIADYNVFVTGEAALNPGLTGTTMGVQWFAMGSTADVDARDNAVVSAPVYLLDGSTKIADSFTDIWDGTIDNQFVKTQFVVNALSPFPWTGSTPAGIQFGTSPLGSSNPPDGNAGQTNGGWMQWNSTPSDELHRMYALSELLTAPSSVPEPSTFIFATLSLLGFGLFGWRRKRV